MKNYFGTDGIRFIYQEDTKELISKIGKSLSYNKNKKIIIGHDTRFSSEEISNTIISQLTNKEIIYVGVCSTPCISYLSKKHNSLGIMITASHNPYFYNGIKIFNKGLKLSQKQQLKLSNLINTVTINHEQANTLTPNKTYLNEYLSYLKTFIEPSNTKIAFDCANGSLSPYINEIIHLINPNNIAINNTPDGNNINEKCGSTNLHYLQEYINKNNIDYGFAFDGDGDRLILVSKNKIYNGDELLYILSQKQKKVVITTNTNLGLIQSLKNKKIKTKTVNVGDSNILNYLIKHKLNLGGESSGHIIQLNLLPSGDGLLNAISIINLLSKNSLDNLLKGYTRYENKLININLKNKNLIKHSLITNLINDYLKTHKNNILINLRVSGTENKVRLYVSHKDKNTLNYISQRIITYLQILDNNIEYDNLSSITIDEKSTFGNNISIKGNTIINNSKIGNNSSIISSVITDSTILNNCSIGPFSHLRNSTKINNNIRIGNFVEIKNSTINDDTKIAHLTYIGDCICGKNVNFGCGTVIVNYDGKLKRQTIIGNNVFIGCNTNIIAPIEIKDNVFIAAGSTITNSLEKNSFAIARAKQITKPNKAMNYPYFKEK